MFYFFTGVLLFYYVMSALLVYFYCFTSLRGMYLKLFLARQAAAFFFDHLLAHALRSRFRVSVRSHD